MEAEQNMEIKLTSITGTAKKSVDLTREVEELLVRAILLLRNRGLGGPENFRPAFTGMKYRANGGNAAFMVGEQGPEVFNQAIRNNYSPSDETTTAAPINANINISAVDAAGVEELLVNQRGNIIGMLEEAQQMLGGFLEKRINSGVNLNGYTNSITDPTHKIADDGQENTSSGLRVPALKQLLLYQNCHV